MTTPGQYVPGQGGGDTGGATAGTKPTGADTNPFSRGDFTVVTAHPAGPPRHRRGAAVNGVEPAAQDVGVEKDSAAALVKSLVGMTPQQMLDLQDRLIAAGRLPKTARTGVADSDTRQAYADLLHETSVYNVNGHNVTPDELLQRAVDARATAAASTAALNDGRPGNVTHLGAGLDLEAQVQSAAQSRLGRKLKPAEAAKFVTIYRHMQQVDSATNDDAQWGARALSATTAGPGVNGISSTIRDTAAPAVAADQFIDHNFAQEAAGQSASSYFGALEHLIGGGR